MAPEDHTPKNTNPDQEEQPRQPSEETPQHPSAQETPESGPEQDAPDDSHLPEPWEEADDEDAALEKEFAELLDQHLPGSTQAPRGELMELPVVAVREDSVLVDIGGKAEASVPIEEFAKVDGRPDVEVGQVIPVVQIGQREDGTPRLSHRQARSRQARKAIREAQEQRLPVKGIVTSVVKGGVMVDVGLDAFMPASQVDLFKIPDLNALLSKEIESYVLEFDPRRNRAVLSRRQLLYERRQQERRDFLETLQVDQVISGKVKSALDFGVFVDLGVVDGFIPREEVSWDRGKSPSEVVKNGEEIELKILSISPESGKITLSRKRMKPNPWDTIDEKYPEGSAVRGTVVAIQPYGAFLHLEEGITGMIHATDMAWATGNKKPSEYLSVGDEITSKVLEVDREKKRLSLGLKQLTKDPWSDVDERFKPGTKHSGTVTSLTNYGAFVKLDEYIEGMVHVSDITWSQRVGHPKEFLKPGDEVEVAVLKIDKKNRRISLGIKQLEDSPFDAYMKKHKVGSTVKGKVTRFAPFGAFVELAPNLEGLIHISHIDEKRVELPESALEQGQEVTVKIISVDKKNHKISLSRKEALKAQERETIRQYTKKKDDVPSGMTFGEALRAAQENKDENSKD